MLPLFEGFVMTIAIENEKIKECTNMQSAIYTTCRTNCKTYQHGVKLSVSEISECDGQVHWSWSGLIDTGRQRGCL